MICFKDLLEKNFKLHKGIQKNELFKDFMDLI